MGGGFYSSETRSVRSESLGYSTKHVDDIFVQNKKRVIHESMEPKKALIRESRDSMDHPSSVPIILGLDVTGSMGTIPHELIKNGLPTIMETIIRDGILDPQILFLAIGDTNYDSYPLQVGQFESADLELDTWLTRTYIERGGGSNFGESYLLAWYYAAKHTVTDAWEKRNQRGFLFTIGDEPSVQNLPSNVINGLMGEDNQESYSDYQLLEMAQEKYNVYHLHIMQGSAGSRSLSYWQNLLGDRCITIENSATVPDKIAEIVTGTKVVLEGEIDIIKGGADKPLLTSDIDIIH